MKIPLSIPNVGEDEKKIALEVLDSGWLAHGDYNEALEEEFKKLLGVRNAVTLNSATSALELALKANDIRGEVIVPSFTFVASANAIVNAGAKPVFCDSDVETRNVAADFIKEKITKDTEAVMVVHFGGQVCRMDEITELCENKGLLLIEDSAETLGATWKGKQAGSFGIGCFSFFPTKNITTGEGGILTTDDDALADKVRALSGHGIVKTTKEREKESFPWRRDAILPGHNYRLSNVLAGIGYAQILKLKEMNEKRQEIASMYDRLILESEIPVKIPFVAENATHVYQMYTILVEPSKRNDLILYLRSRGIGASVHFDPPVHEQTYYSKNYPSGRLPNAEKLAKSAATLPIYPAMSNAEVEYVVAALRDYFD